jgi:hypothetical protein
VRIFTRHNLARAFPELDRYSDEQRRRFLRSAKGSLWRRGARGLVILSTWPLTCAVLTGAMWGLIWLLSPGHDTGRFDPSLFVGVLVFGIGFASLVLPFFVLLLTRDVLVHRRVRTVLRDRGKCTGCGYVLVGMPVGEGARVTCPECGVVTEVDPALGDLVIEGADGSRYQPSEHGVPPPRFFTPGLVKFVKRAIIAAAVGVPLIAGVSFGVRELMLQRQATRASAMKPGAQGLAAHIEKGQPAGSAGQPNAYDPFMHLALERSSIENAFTTNKKPSLDPDPKVDVYVDVIYSKPRNDDDEAAVDEFRREQVVARALMADYAESPTFFARMDEMAASPRSVGPVNLPANQPAVSILLPELGQMRGLARINAARMFLAQEQGDMEEWLRAYEANLALVRMGSSQYTLIHGLVGVAIEALAHSRARELLRSHPSDDVLDRIEQAWQRQPTVPPVHCLEGERLSTHDTLAWFFSEPKRVRWGRFSADPGQLIGSNDLTRSLGSFESNIEEFDRAVDWEKRLTELTPAEMRADPSVLVRPECDHVLSGELFSGYDRWVGSVWRIETDRRGVRTLIALERYRNRHGEYPDSLDALAPEFLPSLPIDPWSGKGLGFVRVDPKADPQGREFLLYSVGADGDDDSGQLRIRDRHSLLRLDAPGNADGDFVINEFDE